jgi:aldehyde:ferredoxin oxidoreductase
VRAALGRPAPLARHRPQRFNDRRALTPAGGEAATLPGRLLEEPIDAADASSVVPLAPMMRRYYAHRGWDEAGMPGRALQKRLRLGR